MTTTEADYSNVPDELQERDQWLMWDASADTPRRPHWRGDFGISWNDPEDWHSFEEAVDAARERESWGIGYVFAYGIDEYPRGMYGALDLDGCLDDEGRPKDWLPSLDEFLDADAYIERSPSVAGLHVPLVGFEPPDWWSDTHLTDKEHEGVEAYDKKFMTFTGDPVDVAGESVAENVDVSGWLAEVYEALTGEEPPIGGNSGSDRGDELEIDVYDVISSHQHPEEERVSHPFHGSGTGSNFKVDEGAETFRCWRHGVTGNALHLLGMEEGIITCGEWDGAGGLSDDTWSEIFEAAREAGYDVGSAERSDRSEPPSQAEIDGVASWERVRDYYRDPDLDDRHARQAAAARVREEYHFATPMDTETLWKYDPETGVYEPEGEPFVREVLSEHLGAYHGQHEVNEILGKVRAQSYIRRDDFDGGEDENLLCCANGVVDLETRELHDHDPEYYFTRAIPVEYDPDATAPAIDEFLEDITRREADKRTMIEMVGAALWPGYEHSKFMILFGEGSNGKSAFFETVEALLGSDNISGWELQKLSENRFATSDLVGKFANIAPDMPGTKLSELGTLKSLTGGDTVMAEDKGEPAFEFVNKATLMFGANRPPVIPEASKAIKRRLVPIRLPHNFTPEDDDNPDARDRQELLGELTADAELSGLLNMALDGLDRLRERGDVSLPETHEERLEYYEQFSDPIKEFRINCLENERGTDVKKAAVYDAYKRFCRDQGYAVKDERVFFRTLRQTTLTYDESRPMRDGERVRVLNDTKFTDTGLDYAPASIIDSEEEETADAVEELAPGDEGVTVEVEVTDRRVDQPEPITSKATIVDTTGEIEAVVWDDSNRTLEEGEYYRIKNARVDEYQGTPQLNINATTGVESIQAGAGKAPKADAGTNEQLDSATPDGGRRPGASEAVQVKERVQEALRSRSVDEPITAAAVAGRIDESPDAVDHALMELANQKEPMITHLDTEEGYRYL